MPFKYRLPTLLQIWNHDFDLYTSFKALVLSGVTQLTERLSKSNNILTLECDDKDNVQIGVELQFEETNKINY